MEHNEYIGTEEKLKTLKMLWNIVNKDNGMETYCFSFKILLRYCVRRTNQID